MVRAWYMDDSTTDQRETHMTQPPNFVSLDELKKIGVNYWQIDSANFETSPELKEIRKEFKYDYEDQVCCQKDASGYDDMLKKFFEEHIHSDDETRLVLDGSGFFDVRDPRSDKWIRIEVIKNDFISIPPGLYHRFTLDTKNYIKVNRYFCGNPVWIPLNRPQDDNPVRLEYLKKFGSA